MQDSLWAVHALRSGEVRRITAIRSPFVAGQLAQHLANESHHPSYLIDITIDSSENLDRAVEVQPK